MFFSKYDVIRGSKCCAAGFTDKQEQSTVIHIKEQAHDGYTVYAHAVLYKVIIAMCAVHTLYEVRVLIRPSNKDTS